MARGGTVKMSWNSCPAIARSVPTRSLSPC